MGQKMSTHYHSQNNVGAEGVLGSGLSESERLTKVIDKLQRRHHNTRRQRSSHGLDRYSVQFFAKDGSGLVADYNLLPCQHTEFGFSFHEIS